MKEKGSCGRWAGVLAPIMAMGLAVAAHGQQTDPEKLIVAGHWKKARAIVESRLAQRPDDPLANYLLSQIRNAFGDYSSPLTLAKRAVALDNRVSKFHRQLAEVLGVEAQHAGAIRLIFLARQFRSEIDTAIALDPRDVQAQRDLLEYYLVAPGIAGGDVQAAAATAQHIGELDPAEGFLARARIASFRRQPAEEETLLSKAARAQPPSYRAQLELARFYLALGHSDTAKAEVAAQQLLKLDPTRVNAYAILAQICVDRGDWNALDSILAESTRQNPDDLTPYYRAADELLSHKRDAARAERYLRVYLEQEPEGNEPSLADARRELALALQAPGQRPGVLAVSK